MLVIMQLKGGAAAQSFFFQLERGSLQQSRIE